MLKASPGLKRNNTLFFAVEPISGVTFLINMCLSLHYITNYVCFLLSFWLVDIMLYTILFLTF